MTAFRFSPGCCCGQHEELCDEDNPGPYIPIASLSDIEPLVLAQTGSDSQYGYLQAFLREETRYRVGTNVKYFYLGDEYRTFFSNGQTASFNDKIAADTPPTAENGAYSDRGTAYTVRKWFNWRKCAKPKAPDTHAIVSYWRRSVQDSVDVSASSGGDGYISQIVTAGGTYRYSGKDAVPSGDTMTATERLQSIWGNSTQRARLKKVVWAYPCTTTYTYNYNCNLDQLSQLTETGDTDSPGTRVDYTWFIHRSVSNGSLENAIDVDPETGYAQIVTTSTRNIEREITVTDQTAIIELTQPVVNINYTAEAGTPPDIRVDKWYNALYG